MGSVIRSATPHDLDALLELEQVFPGDRITRSSFRHLLTKARAEVFVFEQGGKLLGNAIVLYRKGFHGARLYSIVVHPQARGKGVGAALLRRVEEAAVRRGCVSLRLEVREDNTPAIRLYEAHGYTVAGRTADYYQDHSAALRMRKRLLPTEPPILLNIPYYPQTLDFTCGPAVLMMAMAYLGFAEPLTRTLELQLWREATTIFMMSGHGGSSAHGLALAAKRRGFDARVLARDDSIPFMDTVRSEEKKGVIAESHEAFLQEFETRGGQTILRDFSVDDVVAAIDRNEVPLVLVSGYRIYGEKLPHWVVLTGYDERFLYLHDPFILEGTQRADCVHLPLARLDFERMSRFGKARHRYMVILGSSRGS